MTLFENRPLTYGGTSPRSNVLGDRLVRVSNTRPVVVASVAVVALAPALYLIYFMSQVKLYLDFRVYFLGAQHVLDPQLYHVGTTFDLHFPFTYPPVAAMFFWPFTAFSFRLAALVWTTVTLGALASIVRMSLRLARPDFSRRGLAVATALSVGVVFFFEPIWENFHFGQVNLVLGALTMYDVLERPRRRLPRGVLLAVATCVKLIPGIFILYFLFRRQYRTALTAGLTVVALNAIAFALNHRATWDYWTKYAFNASRMGGVLYNSNQSLRGASQRLAHHLLGQGLLTALSALALALGLVVALRYATKRSELAMLVAVGVTGDLVSPISWSHHLIWFIPLTFWLTLAHDRPRGGQWWALLLAGGCFGGVIWLPPQGANQTLHWNWWENLPGNYYFLAMVLTLVALAVGGAPARRQREAASRRS